MKLYVDIHAFRDGDGTKERPFRHVNDAAKIAMPGDEVLVAPGVYREYVCPVHAGTDEARITYRSVEPRGAVITGAEVLTGWTRYQGDTWTARVSNSLFGSYHPYTTYVCGDWYFAPTVRHTGSVYLNDRMMYETVTLEECLAGEADPCSWQPEESRYKWFAAQEGDETVFYANFHALDPNTQNV